MTTSRRSFLKLTAGAAVIIAAPAIVRASSLMKVKPLDAELWKCTERFLPTYVDPEFQWFIYPRVSECGELVVYGAFEQDYLRFRDETAAAVFNSTAYAF